MKAVHQAIAAAAPGDAVTRQALAWRALLRSWGVPSEVVAEHVHPELEGEVVALGQGGAALLRGGAVILRYSIWSSVVDAAVTSGSPLALVYHNVTPGNLLRADNPAVAELCDRGRERLCDLRGRAAVLIADSTFNAAEVREAGLGEAVVVPLLLDLPSRPAEPPTGPPVVLSVGRLAPSKRLEEVIAAFAVYRAGFARDAELILLGPADGFEEYAAGLDRLAQGVAPGAVRLTGLVSDEQRDAWYASAHAYICLSAHEGFCAPLVEALAQGVPVVARRAGAVAETLDGAALLFDQGDNDPALFAEAIHEVVSSSQTREGLRALGLHRIEELRPDRIAARVKEALAPLLADSE